MTLNEYLFLALMSAIIFGCGCTLGYRLHELRQIRARRRRQGETLQPIDWTIGKRTIGDYAKGRKIV